MKGGIKGQPRKQLGYATLIKCVDIIRAHQAEFVETRIGDESLAKRLTQECGEEVTECNAKTAKQASGVKWIARNVEPKPRTPSKRPATASGHALRRSPSAIAIAQSLLELGKSLGHTFTLQQTLEAIAYSLPKKGAEPPLESANGTPPPTA